MRSNELKAGDFLFTHSHDFLGEAIDDAQGGGRAVRRRKPQPRRPGG